MRPLSGADLVAIWERGVGQSTLQQALIILHVAAPEQPWEALAWLSIGERDARLLALREQTFGAQMASVVGCSACQETLEFSLQVADVRQAAPAAPRAPEQWLQHAGYTVGFRLPNSLDLAALTGCADAQQARQLLVQRCVVHASQGDGVVPTTALPGAVLTALAEAMTAADPQAEVQLQLTCPACGHAWQCLFDIATFFWAEVRAQAQRLLREVHTLARAYGWREADILALSPVRRQFYLEMVG